jgi:DNA helicase-2/ATP-dependent DNA helicase PcrA
MDLDAPIVMRQHTPEQDAILEFAASCPDNGMVQAYAGTGKTTILEEIGIAAGPNLPLDAEGKSIQYLVFNAKNAKEAVERMPEYMDCRTINSLGHRGWMKGQGMLRLTLEADKTRIIYKRMIADEKSKAEVARMWEIYGEVTQGVAMAKSVGYVPAEQFTAMARPLCGKGAFHSHLDEIPEDDTSDYIDAVLIKSIHQSYSGLIDFNDQVYMPALFGGTFDGYPLTLVDEYQDLSPVNHALLERCVKGRIVGVGDRYQNIYGFRGAKAAGMDDAIKHYNMTVLPLSVSFRCPSAIVRHVHWHVPEFKWHKEGGNVELTGDTLHSDRITDGSTIICRNNAPLLAAAFKLLATGRSVTVVGVDIGPKLVGIMRKLGPESLTREQVYVQIDNWLEQKLERESKTAPDMAECMRVFAALGRTLGQALIYAEDIFRRRGPITLTTGHKSKGLEYDAVFHIDPHLTRGRPDRPATDQDRNLDYVISTRSKDLLTELTSEQIEW